MVGEPAAIDGATGREDGFAFLSDTRRLASVGADALCISSAEATPAQRFDGWLATSEPATWWSAVAPGPPVAHRNPLVLVRVEAPRGSITACGAGGAA
jgi:hypothetical protein